MTEPINRRLLAIVIIIAIGLVSGVILLYATPFGPWVTSDSVEYVQAAQNVLQGHGLAIQQASGEYAPVTLHPPLYSLFLASAGYLGLDLVQAARWSGALFMAGTTIILGLGLLALLGDPFPAVGLSLTFASSAVILHVHAGLMSEPLFFLTAFGGLLALVAYTSSAKTRYLVGSALLLGAASFTRFIGLAAAGSAILVIMSVGPGPVRHRVPAASLMALLGITPVAAWLLSLPAGMPRFDTLALALSPVGLWNSLEHARGALVNTVWSWNPIALLAPQLRYPQKLTLIGIAVLGLSWIIASRIRQARRDDPGGWRRRPQFSLLLVSALFALSYVLFYVISFFMLDLKLDPDARQFSPLWLMTVLSLLCTCSLMRATGRGRLPSWVAPSTVTLVFLVPAILPTPALISRLHTQGEGYTSPSWTHSELVQRLRDLPLGTPLITNESAAVLFLLGRPAYDFPETASPRTRHAETKFGDDPSDPIEALFRERGAALALFDSAYWQLWDKYREDTQRHLDGFVTGLRVWATAQDGAIYFYR